MRTKKIDLLLPEGKYSALVDTYSKSDLPKLRTIYNLWRKLSVKLNGFNSRSINLPEGLSEIAFCYYMDCVRVKNNLRTTLNYHLLSTKKIKPLQSDDYKGFCGETGI